MKLRQISFNISRRISQIFSISREERLHTWLAVREAGGWRCGSEMLYVPRAQSIETVFLVSRSFEFLLEKSKVYESFGVEMFVPGT